MGSVMQFNAAKPDHSPAEILRAAAGERKLLARGVFLSGVIHVAAALLVLMVPAGGGTRFFPAGTITVDLSTLEPPSAKPVSETAPPPPARPAPFPTLVKRSPIPVSQLPAPGSASPGRQALPAVPAIAPLATELPGAPSSFPVAMTVPASAPPQSQSAATPARGDGPPAAAPSDRSTETPAIAAGAPDSGRVRVSYQSLLRGLIERRKEYPPMARRGRMEGTAVVRVVLARSGAVRRDEVARSSRHPLLDNAALRAVRTVGRFPAVPAELDGDELIFEVPITFRLIGD